MKKVCLLIILLTVISAQRCNRPEDCPSEKYVCLRKQCRLLGQWDDPRDLPLDPIDPPVDPVDPIDDRPLHPIDPIFPIHPIDPVYKTEWPELLGEKSKKARSVILSQNPNLKVSIIPEGSMVTMNYRQDRVRIFQNKKKIVTQVPRIG